MERRLFVVMAGEQAPGVIAARSADGLDAPLPEQGAELWLAWSAGRAALLGAFQRASELEAGAPAAFRRGSGGPDVWLAQDTLHVLLACADADALGRPGGVPAHRIVNRLVRPLLRALTRLGTLAHYFGRDWVSVGRRPAAWVGFAHDSASHRFTFEAFVALCEPFAPPARTARLGKEPASIAEITGRQADPSRLAEAIADAYAEAYGLVRFDAAVGPASPIASAGGVTPARDGHPEGDPPWAATVDEAIGLLGAGPDRHGTFRVGGQWLASRDAVARLEAEVATAHALAVGPIVDAALAQPDVALEGVRSLSSVRDVIVRALALVRDPASRSGR